MESSSIETMDDTTTSGDTTKANYARSYGNVSVSTITESGIGGRHPSTVAGRSSVSLPAVYEASRRSMTQSPAQHEQQYQSVAVDIHDRQLSILDPLSDRVSTILVWQNLTVSSCDDKNKELIRKITSCNRYVPKRKCLLNNVSGAITGGLWAVMGKFYLAFFT
jgi:hypothetical protein